MRGRRLWLVMVALGLGLGQVAAGPPAAAPSADELIAQLGGPRYAARVAAGNRLVALGEPALKALERAAASPDAEVGRRAHLLIQRIEQRRTNELMLTLPPVRLTYKDVPLSTAVADLARKTGLSVTIDPKRVVSSTRSVTLDTGSVPAWEALEQFCRAAGLHEAAPLPALNRGNPYIVEQQLRGGIWIQQDYILSGRAPTAPAETITLIDGTQPRLPADAAHSVRVRAVSPTAEVPFVFKGNDESLLALEVIAHPSLRWAGVLDAQIRRALDERGRVVGQTQADAEMPGAGGGSPYGEWIAFGGGAMMINDIYFGDGMPVNLMPTLTTVRLRTGKAVKRLREVQGAVFGYALAPSATSGTLEEIRSAKGRRVRAPDGGAVEVLDVSVAGDKVTLKLRREFGHVNVTSQQNRGGFNNNMVWGAWGGFRQAPGVMIDMAQPGMTPQPEDAPRFVLEDANGSVLKQLAFAPGAMDPKGTAQDFTLTYQTSKELVPARLRVEGRRWVVLEVPFALKDVRLP